MPARIADPLSGGTLPSNLGLQPDLAARQLPGSLPTFRLMPVPPGSAGSAQSNAAAQSNLLKNPTFQENLSQTGTNTANIATNTTAISALQATSFQGAWSSTTTYSQGASVDYSGAIYVSLVNNNLNNTPSSSPTDWAPTGSSPNYQGAWSSSTAYTTGQTVSVGSTLYIALQNSTNENPASTTGYWQVLSNTSYYYGAWSNSTAYPAGAEVSYNGTVWIALSANTNQTPGIGSSYWTAVGNSTILISAYAGGTTYSAGMQVIGTDGNIYQALQSTTGNAPPNATYWQLVGPSSLTSVPDGTQRFAATASTLTYRPTSNPLTSTDAGSNATVSIASFTMQTSNKGTVSVNSGSVTGLSYGTLYYIYYDDATLAGGSVTFNATTTKTTAINGSGRFFVGSITTAISGGTQTNGNNDGGVGAQGGQTLVFSFSAVTNTNSGTAVSGAISNASFDGDPTTKSSISVTSANSSAASITSVVSGSPANLTTYSSVTLYVRSAVPTNTVNPGASPAAISYSYAGGSGTVMTVGPATTRSLTTDSVSLPTNINLGTLTVTCSVFRNSGSAQVVELDVYEIWVVATT